MTQALAGVATGGGTGADVTALKGALEVMGGRDQAESLLASAAVTIATHDAAPLNTTTKRRLLYHRCRHCSNWRASQKRRLRHCCALVAWLCKLWQVGHCVVKRN